MPRPGRAQNSSDDGSSASGASAFMSTSSFAVRGGNKFELKRKFYEKLDDFKHRTVLYKEPGFIVYRAKCAYSGGVVVLKGYSRETLTEDTKRRVWNEVQILQGAQCPFIVKCFDSFEDQGWWWLVLENCAAGDLFRVMQANGRITCEGWLVSQVLFPLLQTLAYLHNEGIIHRDVKPEHVLFNSEKVAKLSGFFLAQDVTKFGYPKDMVGTLDYVAPEVLKLAMPDHKAKAKSGLAAPNYDFKIDIWMLGVLAFDALVGEPPYAGDAVQQTVQRVLLDDPVFPDDISDDAADFVLCCLTKEPNDRPTARQLIQHPWIKNNIMWVPTQDFEDPMPEIDFAFYEDDLVPDDESDDLIMGERVVWYKPSTWLHALKRNKDHLDDLEPEVPADPASGAGGDGARSAAMNQLSIAQELLSQNKLKLGEDEDTDWSPDRKPSSGLIRAANRVAPEGPRGPIISPRGGGIEYDSEEEELDEEDENDGGDSTLAEARMSPRSNAKPPPSQAVPPVDIAHKVKPSGGTVANPLASTPPESVTSTPRSARLAPLPQSSRPAIVPPLGLAALARPALPAGSARSQGEQVLKLSARDAPKLSARDSVTAVLESTAPPVRPTPPAGPSLAAPQPPRSAPALSPHPPPPQPTALTPTPPPGPPPASSQPQPDPNMPPPSPGIIPGPDGDVIDLRITPPAGFAAVVNMMEQGAPRQSVLSSRPGSRATSNVPLPAPSSAGLPTGVAQGSGSQKPAAEQGIPEEQLDALLEEAEKDAAA